MCFSKKPIIDFETPVNNINIGNANWSESYKEAMSCLIVEEESKNKAYPRHFVKRGVKCPACLKYHNENDGAFVVTWRTSTDYLISCMKTR